MIYTKEIIDNKLGDRTSSKAVAKSLGWTIALEDNEVETGYDNQVYLVGYAPVQTEAELLEIAKTDKLAEIKQAFETVSSNGYTVSSLGYRVDATTTSLTDVQGLMRLVNGSLVDLPVMFRDYDNEFHECTLEDLTTLELEITTHGVTVYAEKWALEAQVESAQTVEAVQAVDTTIMSGYDW